MVGEKTNAPKHANNTHKRPKGERNRTVVGMSVISHGEILEKFEMQRLVQSEVGNAGELNESNYQQREQVDPIKSTKLPSTRR